MRAATAAAYVDEVSVEAFQHAVGSLYPRPVNVSGKGDRWLKEDLDAAIEKTASRVTAAPGLTKPTVIDASGVL